MTHSPAAPAATRGKAKDNGDWLLAGDPRELSRRVGHPNQVAGVRLLEGAEGPERGARTLHVWTGSGLQFDVLADRALDVCACSYRGIPLAWISPAGEPHPAYCDPSGAAWLRTFQGGLLATCGLDHFGAPCVDEGVSYGLHGRIGGQPARFVNHGAAWVGGSYEISVSGEVRQASPFGENLVLRRRISTALGSRKIRIDDTVANEGHERRSHLILYHMNLGYPLLSEHSRLQAEVSETIARDAEAARGISQWRRFQPPTAGCAEQVFIHTAGGDPAKMAAVELQNPKLGLGLRISFDRKSLPYFAEWKMMGEGAYILGVEPANCRALSGRSAIREKGELPYLEPGQTRRYAIEVEVVEL